MGGDITKFQARGRNKRTVWNVATAPYSGSHFATFPPELPNRCILAGSQPGDTVLDPFGGSGTTAVVAQALQRDCVTIELSSKYCTSIKDRLNKGAVRV